MRPVRIAITGPESTGKSTLASFLAGYFDATLVPEFARNYLSDIGPDYNEEDLDKIAQGQFEAQQKATLSGAELVILDTDMLVIKVWSMFKFGQVSSRIRELYLAQQVDFSLLTYFDIPWEFDTLRENPKDRKDLFAIYKNELQQHGPSYSIVSGSTFDRNYIALRAVNQIMRQQTL